MGVHSREKWENMDSGSLHRSRRDLQCSQYTEKGYIYKIKGQKTRSRQEDRNIIIFSGIEQPVSLIGKKWKTWALCISEKHHATHLRSPGSASSCNFQALLSKVLTWSTVTTVGTLASRGVPPQASAPVSSAIATSESETAVSSRG